jgi:hypothetical protein
MMSLVSNSLPHNAMGNIAANAGHLSIIIWLKKERPKYYNKGDILTHATKGSQLHILKWLHEQGDLSNAAWKLNSSYMAASSGFLGLLEWATNSGYECGPDIKEVHLP